LGSDFLFTIAAFIYGGVLVLPIGLKRMPKLF
jgi:hypothetical protein